MNFTNVSGTDTPKRIGIERMTPNEDHKAIITSAIESVLTNLQRPVTPNEDRKDLFFKVIKHIA